MSHSRAGPVYVALQRTLVTAHMLAGREVGFQLEWAIPALAGGKREQIYVLSVKVAQCNRIGLRGC